MNPDNVQIRSEETFKLPSNKKNIQSRSKHIRSLNFENYASFFHADLVHSNCWFGEFSN
jgi:hypothetical protein